MNKEQKIKKLEDELASANKLINQFKSLLDCIPDPIFMKDDNFSWIYANPTTLKLYNIDPNNYVGKTEDELLPKEFINNCIKSDKKAKNTKKLSKSIEKVRDESGKVKYFEFLKVPSYKNHKFEGIIGIARDMTNTKNFQNELEYALDEQLKINQNLKMASLGEMIENITHQWKQPLNNLSILSSSNQYYLKHDLNFSSQSLIRTFDTINKNVEFMNKTIDVFKNYFKKDTEKENFLLQEIMNNTITICKGTLETNQIELSLDLEDELIIFGNKNELMQILINILTNAKDAFESKEFLKEIKIVAKKKENNILITIEDNANGISEEILKKYLTLILQQKRKMVQD